MARMKTWKVKYSRLNWYSGYSREYTTTIEAATAHSAMNKAEAKFREWSRRNDSNTYHAISAELA